jgi:TIR domain-containing protein
MAEREFDVALSFAGEQRTYVEEVATHLKSAGVSLFYDEFEEADLWGKDLAVHLGGVYGRARYVVIFVSKEYASKPWPQHEFQNALANAVLEQTESILPVRFDDTALPGLRRSIHYLDGRRIAPSELAQRILEKLGRTPVQPTASTTAKPLRVPSVPPTSFNPYAVAEEAVHVLRHELARRSNVLNEQGYGVDLRERNGRVMYRVMRVGEVVYGLDVWIGGAFGDNTICFATGTRISGNPNTTNGTATVEWDRYRGVPIMKTFNMSILREMGHEYRLTPAEFADELWEAICQHLEGMRS